MRMELNWFDALFWGFCSTLVLTTIMSASKSLGFTRIDFPFMLGTMFTVDRDRAKWIGFCFHLLGGWVFTLFYVAAFYLTGMAHWWFGMMIGMVHAVFLLVVGMGLLPAIHPRMASEQDGPEPTRLLEPPGFLALHYGRRTPVVMVVAHLIYGGMLGFFYRF